MAREVKEETITTKAERVLIPCSVCWDGSGEYTEYGFRPSFPQHVIEVGETVELHGVRFRVEREGSK